MYSTLLVLYFLVTTCLIALILLQPGKGGIMGNSEGGVSSFMMSVGRSASPIAKICRVMAAAFMLICLLLGRYGTRSIQTWALPNKPDHESENQNRADRKDMKDASHAEEKQPRILDPESEIKKQAPNQFQ